MPEPFRSYRTKPAIAIEEIDRVIAAGVRFGCVLADAGYALAPGLAATVDVKTGTRRIVSYLLSPIQTSISQAGRER